jgi:hypothetical protein
MSALAKRVGMAIVAAAALSFVAPQLATAETWGMNGQFTATSNGQYARTNDQYDDEAVVRTTWTVSTTCINPTDCTGTVTSDAGWSAPIYARSGVWYVKRAIANWRPCGDGTFADGLQMFQFYAGDIVTGQLVPPTETPSAFLGQDITNSPSGACGINKQLEIAMPFNLQPL